MVDFSNIEKVPSDWCQFFLMFSRMEFALKDFGFFRCIDKKRHAGADWHAFAKELPENFFDQIKGSGELALMIEKPPKSQIVLSGKTLGWQEYNGKIESTKALFEAMKTVRNNLFHGGKNGYPDEGRDAQLIEACIHLMTKALENHDGVRNAFERKY